jgi:hypothetical protein
MAILLNRCRMEDNLSLYDEFVNTA